MRLVTVEEFHNVPNLDFELNGHFFVNISRKTNNAAGTWLCKSCELKIYISFEYERDSHFNNMIYCYGPNLKYSGWKEYDNILSCNDMLLFDIIK